MTTAYRPSGGLHVQIEQAIARGESNERICTALGITPITVDEARDYMDSLAGEGDDEAAAEISQVVHSQSPAPLWNRPATYDARLMGNTPGYAALAEAMRLEQARIYGTVQREYRQPHTPAVLADAEVYELHTVRRRRSA